MSVIGRTEAPDLPGYDFIEPIGSGGYSDVYLYEQRRPRRPVAVKVLDVESLPTGVIDTYAEEANVMAMVSAHPYIVQIFHADISPNGRPYLVMEYYSGPNYLQRSRQEPIGVAEVLRVGIQIASAVEVAHRVGILHRDIKPANILTSAYRKPGLTDFGIAAVEGLQSGHDRDGLSIPWSPAEAINDGIVDRRSDVYSLAASLYTMLTGRAPFEVVAGDNRTLAMMTRIERSPVSPTHRDDVPDALERVLATALSKERAHRPQTAVAFAHQLQEIETLLQLPVTPLELPDTAEVQREFIRDDSDATRAKAVSTVDVEFELVDLPSAQEVSGGHNVELRTPTQATALDDTIGRSERPGAPAMPTPNQARSRWVWVIPSAIVAVLAVVLVVGMLFRQPSSNEDVTAGPQNNNDRIVGDTLTSIAPPVAVNPSPVAVVNAVESDGSQNVFRWEPVEGARYQVSVIDSSTVEVIDEPRYETYAECVTVRVVASNQMMSAPTLGCVVGDGEELGRDG